MVNSRCCNSLFQRVNFSIFRNDYRIGLQVVFFSSFVGIFKLALLKCTKSKQSPEWSIAPNAVNVQRNGLQNDTKHSVLIWSQGQIAIVEYMRFGSVLQNRPNRFIYVVSLASLSLSRFLSTAMICCGCCWCLSLFAFHSICSICCKVSSKIKIRRTDLEYNWSKELTFLWCFQFFCYVLLFDPLRDRNSCRRTIEKSSIYTNNHQIPIRKKLLSATELNSINTGQHNARKEDKCVCAQTVEKKKTKYKIRRTSPKWIYRIADVELLTKLKKRATEKNAHT